MAEYFAVNVRTYQLIRRNPNYAIEEVENGNTLSLICGRDKVMAYVGSAVGTLSESNRQTASSFLDGKLDKFSLCTKFQEDLTGPLLPATSIKVQPIDCSRVIS